MAVTSTKTSPNRGYYITNPNNAPVLGKFLKITIHFPETGNLMSPAKYVFFFEYPEKSSHSIGTIPMEWDNPNGMRPNLRLESWMGHLQIAWPKFFETNDWNLGFRKPWNPVEASRLARGPTAAPHFRASFRAFHFLPVDPAWQGAFLNWTDLIHAGMYPLRNLANGSEWIIPPLAQGRICSNPSGFLRGQVFLGEWKIIISCISGIWDIFQPLILSSVAKHAPASIFIGFPWWKLVSNFLARQTRRF